MRLAMAFVAVVGVPLSTLVAISLGYSSRGSPFSAWALGLFVPEIILVNSTLSLDATCLSFILLRRLRLRVLLLQALTNNFAVPGRFYTVFGRHSRDFAPSAY